MPQSPWQDTGRIFEINTFKDNIILCKVLHRNCTKISIYIFFKYNSTMHPLEEVLLIKHHDYYYRLSSNLYHFYSSLRAYVGSFCFKETSMLAGQFYSKILNIILPHLQVKNSVEPRFTCNEPLYNEGLGEFRTREFTHWVSR